MKVENTEERVFGDAATAEAILGRAQDIFPNNKAAQVAEISKDLIQTFTSIKNEVRSRPLPRGIDAHSEEAEEFFDAELKRATQSDELYVALLARVSELNEAIERRKKAEKEKRDAAERKTQKEKDLAALRETQDTYRRCGMADDTGILRAIEALEAEL